MTEDRLISIPGILLAAAFGWLLLGMRREVEPEDVDDDPGFGNDYIVRTDDESGYQWGDKYER